jgi:hypothetical protein
MADNNHKSRVDAFMSFESDLSWALLGGIDEDLFEICQSFAMFGRFLLIVGFN